jgi:hypothetical protein
MPITYTVIDETEDLVYARATGAVYDADLLAHEAALLRDPKVKPGFRQLLDLRWVRDDGITAGVVEPLLQLHREHRHKLRGSHYAVVALSATWFRLGARYSNESRQVSMIVFNEPMTACIWLGVDPNLPVCRFESAPVPLPAD